MRPTLKLKLLAAASIFLASAGLEAQAAPKVADIRSNHRPWLNEVVRIEGFATQFVVNPAESTRFFILKDDWGGLLRVRTSRVMPEVGHRYAVTGPVGFDPTTNDIFLSEESRIALDIVLPSDGAAVAMSSPPPPPPVERDLRIWLVAGLGGLLLIIGVALALVLRRGRSRPASRTSEIPITVAPASASPMSISLDAPPAPQQVIEGRTIKMHAPPPGTLKLLPGWLEVVAGDDVVREIRFYRTKGESIPETTFGRATGRPYTHIQLKPMTVSSRQARVLFDGGSPKLTNLAPADSNPTKVNGRELATNESVPLAEGDRVEMGEVVFKFHAA